MLWDSIKFLIANYDAKNKIIDFLSINNKGQQEKDKNINPRFQ